MLEIIHPRPFVPSTVYMHVNSVAISFIIYPVTFVDVAIDVNKFTLAKRTIVFPVTFVTGTVWPSLFSYSITESSYPLANVVGTRLENIDWSFFSLSIRIIWGLRERFLLFFNSKVSAICSLSLSYQCNLLSC